MNEAFEELMGQFIGSDDPFSKYGVYYTGCPKVLDNFDTPLMKLQIIRICITHSVPCS